MSWNGSVRCGHCYGQGHNKRSCEQLTQTMTTRAQEELDGGEGRDGYWVTQLAKRTQIWLDTGLPIDDTMKKNRRGGVRRCKYCNRSGHNKATCPELKNSKADYLDRAVKARKVVYDEVASAGIGIGALYKRSHYGTPAIYMVTKVDWSIVNHETLKQGNPDFMIMQLLTGGSQADGWHKTRSSGFPRIPTPLPDGVFQSDWDGGELVGPVKVSGKPGAEWFDGSSIDLKAVFADRESPNHYENRWEDQ